MTSDLRAALDTGWPARPVERDVERAAALEHAVAGRFAIVVRVLGLAAEPDLAPLVVERVHEDPDRAHRERLVLARVLAGRCVDDEAILGAPKRVLAPRRRLRNGLVV